MPGSAASIVTAAAKTNANDPSQQDAPRDRSLRCKYGAGMNKTQRFILARGGCAGSAIRKSEFIDSQVASGRYASSNEVVQEALRLIERFGQAEIEKLQWMQNAWREGIDSGDAGEIDFAELKQGAASRGALLAYCALRAELVRTITEAASPGRLGPSPGLTRTGRLSRPSVGHSRQLEIVAKRHSLPHFPVCRDHQVDGRVQIEAATALF
jgi:antitoxin ParD1/3/4